MLEVKKLSKIYTQKDGTPVKALTDINITFPEKGMVFLLGKSGSGKSTLLNICSGLDSPSEGEIIVKGRSSKEFSQSDFDSYRNTFVGFIFQEYNILNEFSVEENISLALELQDRPSDKEKIENILGDIGLRGFANRSPSTLSGGEKQRIAIARALVKRPEIIMADEPSGALDSTTGKQIFEILKEMSKDKLVIVVSHDRDFAEQYGDRIIELKDGKVISDVSKVTEGQVTVTENLKYTGQLLHIRDGALLEQEDFEKLRSIFREAHHEIIVVMGEEDVKDIKKIKNIEESGVRKVFRQSKECEKKLYKPEDSQFISSKLPFKHALKIGVSSLKNKPIRLAFTTILCIVAFTLFGLLSTMLLYNSGSSFKKSLSKSDLNVVKVQKEYAMRIDSYVDQKLYASYQKGINTHFSKSELQNMKSLYGKDAFGGVSVSYRVLVRDTKWKYWQNKINTIAYMTDDNSLYQTIIGTYPQKNDEICISSYMASVLLNCNAVDEKGNPMLLDRVEDVLEQKIHLSGKVYTITGIFDCGNLPEKFDALKTELKHINDMQLLSDFESVLEDGLYLVVFTTEANVREFGVKNSDKQNGLKLYQSISLSMGPNFPYIENQYGKIAYKGFSKLEKATSLHSLDAAITSIKENEIIISENMLYEIVSNVYTRKRLEINNANEIQRYSEIESLCEAQLGNITSEEKTHNLTRIMESLKNDNIELIVSVKPYDVEQGRRFGKATELKVVGFWAGDFTHKNHKLVYVSDAVENEIMETQKKSMEYYEVHSTQYVNEDGALYSDIFLPYNHSTEQTKIYSELYQNDEYRQDDSREKFAGFFMNNLEAVDETVKEMSKVFLLVGVAFAIFAALLLSNFISVSIAQKRKEIGILRAMGAKGTEVFKIFFVETFVIVSACIFISTIASIIVCYVINRVLVKSIGAELFVFGIGSFVLLVLISMITAFLATYFPVNNAAKKKPIDSIRTI